jgi:hypothetical protein
MGKKFNVDLDRFYDVTNPNLVKKKYPDSIVEDARFISDNANQIINYLKELEWIMQKDLERHRDVSDVDKLVLREKLKVVENILIYLDSNIRKK